MTEPLIIRRLLPASCEDVFAAWTDPASMQVWLCPGPGVKSSVVEMDLRVGGAFRIDMHGGSGVAVHTGHYREIIPPSRLVFTWRSAVTQHRDTLVTIELAVHPDGTELTLTHTALLDEASRTAHQGGWRHIVDTLATWLAK